MDFSEYIGMTTAEGQVVIERAPVSQFAAAIKDGNPVYRNAESAAAAGFAGIPAPPTYGFIAQHWGQWEERQPTVEGDGRNPMAEVMGGLMAKGGIVLHGEQEFTYHRPVVVGDVLDFRGEVADIYQKTSGSATMTFMVIVDTYTDADGGGEPVLTSTMNLIHRG